MNADNKTYKKFATARAVRSPMGKNCLCAFFTGGTICTIAHGLRALYFCLGMSEDNAGLTASVTLIFAAVLLTGLGVFDKLAKHAGAGTLVPITGFSNAVASCAIDSRSEGYVLGVGANMFKIAGPVIVYGTVAGAVYGVLYYIIGLI